MPNQKIVRSSTRHGPRSVPWWIGGIPPWASSLRS